MTFSEFSGFVLQQWANHLFWGTVAVWFVLALLVFMLAYLIATARGEDLK